LLKTGNFFKITDKMDYSENIYTVTRLTEEIKELLEGEFPYLWVEGEISNFRVPPSGHYYFTLKDNACQIRVVYFKSGQLGLSFRPENGLHVLCFGRLSVYTGRGEYQIILERMELRGWGALQLAFEQLKERLFKEGLFDPERKKNLPPLPRRVAVVTSPTGAVIQDFLRVLYRRFHNIQIFIYPVLVQGESASWEIEEAIRALNRAVLDIEVIVLARGGGSLEDLWPFNEERVARAIAASSIPVISAIGHEVDFTIADFTADLRASTPSAAAELLIQPQEEWESRIKDFQNRLVRQLFRKMDLYQEKLFYFQKRIADPRRRLTDWTLRLDDYEARIRSSLQRVLVKKRDTLVWIQDKLLMRNPGGLITAGRNQVEIQKLKLKGLFLRKMGQLESDLMGRHKTLQALSPWGILDRGYALVRTLPDLSLVKEVEDTHPGRRIQISLARGELDCLVEQTRKKEGHPFVQRTI
jgi:exodeoxyribonuclease VII large subunit